MIINKIGACAKVLKATMKYLDGMNIITKIIKYFFCALMQISNAKIYNYCDNYKKMIMIMKTVLNME